MNKGAVFCIVDGLTDESFKLEQHSSLKALAQQGAWGRFTTVPPGFQVESYPCIASLLGVEAPMLPPQARGYLEAVGAGLAVAEDDLILRGSWMCVNAEDIICGLAPAPLSAPPLPSGCEHYSLGGYKALLILRECAKLLPYIKTFAPHDSSGQQLAEVLPLGEPRLGEIVRLSHEQKRVLLPWGQSVLCKLPSLSYRAAAVGAAPIFAGLTRVMGLDFYTEPGFNGDVDTDLCAKTRLTLGLAQNYPLVVLHINGADEAAHRRDVPQKQAFLHRVNSMVLQPLLEAGLPLLVCGDHGTSPLSGRHVGGEQPFVLAGTGWRGDLGTLPASKALKLLLEEK